MVGTQTQGSKATAAPAAERLPAFLDSPRSWQLIDIALEEDVGQGDITSETTIAETLSAQATVLYKQSAVVAGLPVLAAVFRRVDPTLSISMLVPEGTFIEESPLAVARVTGSARSILTAERTALNFIQRLSGIATATRKFVERARGTDVEILDTRKTTPALRAFEKYAVRQGGGVSHRFGLYDAILIKDNHVKVAGGVYAAVVSARDRRPAEKIEVETTTLAEVEEALKAGADVILLDNMSPPMVEDAIATIAGKCRIEVSGGINLNTVSDYLIPGVDAISVGAITHSAGSVDISLEVEF